MGKIVIAEEAGAATPASGSGTVFVDSSSSLWGFKSNAGRYHGVTTRVSTAAQGAGFASDTYVTDSGLLIPSFGMQASMVFIWKISASKSAGSATPIYQVRIGSGQATTDTSRLSMTGPAGTAAADVGLLTIIVTVRSVSATGVIQGHASWSHNGAGTGFANNDAGAVEATSSTFDNTAQGGLFVGLSINGGTSANWTLTQCVGFLYY